MHELFIDFKKAYNSVKREVLYNILLEFGILKKLVSLIEMCLNDTFSNVRVSNILSDKFPIQNGQMDENHTLRQKSRILHFASHF
jgi:hypothetical protein